MKSQSRLHNVFVDILNENIFWKDFRHIKTAAWMIVGLINSGKISLSAGHLM